MKGYLVIAALPEKRISVFFLSYGTTMVMLMGAWNFQPLWVSFWI